jgi:hypothetical protein
MVLRSGDHPSQQVNSNSISQGDNPVANVLTLTGKAGQGLGGPGGRMIFTFRCVLSGSYVQGAAIGVPGETLSFNTAANPNKLSRPKLPGAPAGRLPGTNDCEVLNTLGGFTARVEQAATSPTQANFALRIFQAGSGAAQPAELTAGAYPAALTDANGFVIQVSVPIRYN